MVLNTPPTDVFDGLSPASIMEVDKQTGCFIGFAGSMPETGRAYLYHDNRNHFYFYAISSWSGSSSGSETYDVIVRDASAKRFSGIVFDETLQGDLSTIRQNMEKYFDERRFVISSQQRPSNEIFRRLIIDWHLPKMPHPQST